MAHFPPLASRAPEMAVIDVCRLTCTRTPRAASTSGRSVRPKVQHTPGTRRVDRVALSQRAQISCGVTMRSSQPPLPKEQRKTAQTDQTPRSHGPEQAAKTCLPNNKEIYRGTGLTEFLKPGHGLSRVNGLMPGSTIKLVKKPWVSRARIAKFVQGDKWSVAFRSTLKEPYCPVPKHFDREQ